MADNRIKREYCEHGKPKRTKVICRPCCDEGLRLRDLVRRTVLTHDVPLRRGLPLRWSVPVDLTEAEVDRVAAWLRTLVLPSEKEATP